MTLDQTTTDARRGLMGILARATRRELETAVERFAPLPAIEDLRPVETGLVMLRGRIGGDGAPFNLGEATVTRAAVRLNQRIGTSYILGRAPEQARAAAMLDALWQDDAARAVVEEAIAPVRERLLADRQAEQARTDRTRVEFFTLVRGDD